MYQINMFLHSIFNILICFFSEHICSFFMFIFSIHIHFFHNSILLHWWKFFSGQGFNHVLFSFLWSKPQDGCSATGVVWSRVISTLIPHYRGG